MPKRTDSQSSAVARAAQSAGRTRVKAVVNIGRVELEMLRNKPAIRTIEPLARFQVSSRLLPQTLPWQDCPGLLTACRSVPPCCPDTALAGLSGLADCALYWAQVSRQMTAHAHRQSLPVAILIHIL